MAHALRERSPDLGSALFLSARRETGILRMQTTDLTKAQRTEVAGIAFRAFSHYGDAARMNVCEDLSAMLSSPARLQVSGPMYLAFDRSTLRILGFAVNSQLQLARGTAAVEFAGDAIDPDFQGIGLYSSLTRIRIMDAMEAGRMRILFATINPIVEGTVIRCLERFRGQGAILDFETSVVPLGHRPETLTEISIIKGAGRVRRP